MKPYGTTSKDKVMMTKKGSRSTNALKGKWSRTENNNFERGFKKRTRFEAKREIENKILESGIN